MRHPTRDWLLRMPAQHRASIWMMATLPNNLAPTTQLQQRLESAGNATQSDLAALAFAFTASRWAFAVSLHDFCASPASASHFARATFVSPSA